ncbi:MAG: PQQ-like beta-propeller repeat protein, partial [Planctomycetales bacterium]
MRYFPACAAAWLMCLGPQFATAENWPGWRGPRGDGTSMETKLPLEWNDASGKNIAWKVPAPGEGHASPIVWEDRIFLAACLKDRQERVLVCLDRKTGKTLWSRSVLRSPLETKHRLNSYASSTPATDGELVYVTF